MRLIFLILPIFLFATPSLDEVLNYPKSYYRDFWIFEYMKKIDDPIKVETLYNEITYKKEKHFKLLATKYDIYEYLYNCQHINKDNYLDFPKECILQNGFKMSDILKMNKDEIDTLLNYLPNSKIKKEIELLSTKK